MALITSQLTDTQAKILGALAHLRNVCGAEDAGQWRSRMGNLIETEARSAARKAKLAGAYTSAPCR